MASTNLSSPSSLRLTGWIFVTIALLVGLAGCIASEAQLRGAEGEYCNDVDNHSDCRVGLACENFVCTDTDAAPSTPADCERICDRLDDCDAGVDNCIGRCENTTDGWGHEAVDYFTRCFTEDKSCEQLRESDNPPQTCYEEIPIDEQRTQRCQDFVQTSLDCAAGSDELDELDRACRGTARTAGSARWSGTDNCTDYDADSCTELFDCLNDTFELDPQLQ